MGNATSGRDFLTDLERIEDDARKIQRAAAEVTGTAESADGLIEATVGAGGELLELHLDPRIYRNQDSDVLATDICLAVREAAAQAQQRLLSEVLGHPAEESGTRAIDVAFEPFVTEIERLRGGRPT